MGSFVRWLIIIPVAIVLASCGQPKSQEEVVGQYVQTNRDGVAVINLFLDGTFTHDYLARDGEGFSEHGNWSFDPSFLNDDAYIESSEFTATDGPRNGETDEEVWIPIYRDISGRNRFVEYLDNATDYIQVN